MLPALAPHSTSVSRFRLQGVNTAVQLSASSASSALVTPFERSGWVYQTKQLAERASGYFRSAVAARAKCAKK